MTRYTSCKTHAIMDLKIPIHASICVFFFSLSLVSFTFFSDPCSHTRGRIWQWRKRGEGEERAPLLSRLWNMVYYCTFTWVLVRLSGTGNKSGSWAQWKWFWVGLQHVCACVHASFQIAFSGDYKLKTVLPGWMGLRNIVYRSLSLFICGEYREKWR